MKKLIATALAVVLVASFVFAGYSAQAIPSTKTAVASADLDRAVVGEWKDVLSTQIRVSGDPKDLVIAVTAECALATNVKLHGKGESESQAKIMVRALVDDEEVVAKPGPVVFADRLMKVKGDLNDSEAWFEIYMATRNANGFNFIATNVGQGEHNIRVQAKGFVEGVPPDPEELLALIGNRTLVVNEVNLK